MKTKFKLFISVFILLIAQPALAYIDLNFFYSGDTLGTTTDTKTTNMFAEVSIGFAIDKKQSYLVGWNYSQMSVTTASTTTTKYSSTQMGPRFIWRIGKSKNWSLGLGYYLLTDAKYDGSGTEVDWEGSALKVDFGYAFEVATDLHLGIRGNYSSASYTEQLTAGANYTEISYKRTHMYPSVYLIWIW